MKYLTLVIPDSTASIYVSVATTYSFIDPDDGDHCTTELETQFWKRFPESGDVIILTDDKAIKRYRHTFLGDK